MILYSFRRCPYAMRARGAVIASGLHVELREVALRDKPAALLAASPKGTVPVLVLADGGVIDQSLDIMRRLLAIADPHRWLDGDDADLIAVNDGPFKRHLDRYKYADRAGSGGPDSDWAVHRAAATDCLANFDLRLRKTEYLGTRHHALTDMAIVPFVRQFAETDRSYFDALPLPALHRWLARYLASPMFERIMPRTRPWIPGDAPLYFPVSADRITL